MKITMKPLKGDSFEVEADPATKVEELKKSVAAAAAEFPAEQQKLIYSGRILKDDELVQDIGIKPGQFVVVMAAKAKPPGSSTSALSAPPPQPAPPPTAQEAPTTQGVAAPDATASAAANHVTSAGMEATITQLCDMGFARDEVERCLSAAFNNPDRAVEYLTNGIPSSALPPQNATATPPAAAATPTAPAPLAAAGRGAAFPAMRGGSPSPLPPTLAALRNNPQFGQLAGVVAQNPQMLARILPALAQSNPEIVQAIQSNPEGFMQMLQETAAAGGGGAGGAGATGGHRAAAQDPVDDMLAAGGGSEEGGAEQLQQMAGALAQYPWMLEHILPQLQQSHPELAAAIQENPQAFLQMLQEAGPDIGEPMMGSGAEGDLATGGTTVIQLGEEENAAVDRLVALGFDRQTAAQAYLACDKSEELAANFLFDHGGDADMD